MFDVSFPHKRMCSFRSVLFEHKKDTLSLLKLIDYCQRFEPRSHFKSRLSLIVRVNVVLNRTVVVDSDCTFRQPQCSPKILAQQLRDESWPVRHRICARGALSWGKGG